MRLADIRNAVVISLHWVVFNRHAIMFLVMSENNSLILKPSGSQCSNSMEFVKRLGHVVWVAVCWVYLNISCLFR